MRILEPDILLKKRQTLNPIKPKTTLEPSTYFHSTSYLSGDYSLCIYNVLKSHLTSNGKKKYALKATILFSCLVCWNKFMYCIWLTGVHARSHTSLLLRLPSSQQLLLFCLYTRSVVTEHNARLPYLTSVWSAKEIQQRKPKSKKANDCILPLNNKIWYWSDMFSVITVTI